MPWQRDGYFCLQLLITFDLRSIRRLVPKTRESWQT